MGLEEQLDAAKSLVEDDPAGAVVKLRELVFEAPGTDVEATRIKEQAIGSLSEAYVKLGDAKSLADLLSQLRDFFGAIPKAKTAKIVRGIIDQLAKIPGSTQLQARVHWTAGERRRRCTADPQTHNERLQLAWCWAAALCARRGGQPPTSRATLTDPLLHR